MKYFLIILSILIISCGESENKNCSGLTPIPDDGPEKLSFWEIHFGVVYEDLKLSAEGVYQTEEAVYYEGEMQILEFVVKIDDKKEIGYQIGECGDFLWIPLLISFDGRLHMAVFTENEYLFSRELSENPGASIYDGNISMSEYEYYNQDDIMEYIPIVKISNEIPEDIDWGYNYCDQMTDICSYLEEE